MNVFEPDVLLPVQHARRTGARRGQKGEYRLMMAILEDAVDVYLKHAGAKQGAKRALFDEAERWIDDADTTWIFSFESICHVFDIDPEAVRGGLHAHKRRLRGERGTVVTLPVQTPQDRSDLGLLAEGTARA
jgi:hypothetical protein